MYTVYAYMYVYIYIYIMFMTHRCIQKNIQHIPPFYIPYHILDYIPYARLGH